MPEASYDECNDNMRERKRERERERKREREQRETILNDHGYDCEHTCHEEYICLYM